MSHTLSQPEEVNHALAEMAWTDIAMYTPIAEKAKTNRIPPGDWSGGYVSPYRAVHMKSIRSISPER